MVAINTNNNTNFVPDEHNVKSHMAACSICNLEPTVVEEVNERLIRNFSDGEVQRFLENKYGIQIKPPTISRHRRYLPFTISNAQYQEILEKARRNALADLPAERLTDMETRIATVRQKVIAAQEVAKERLWQGVIPAFIQKIEEELESGHANLRDLAYALDIVMKNSLLLAGNATERTEVTQRDEYIVEQRLISDPETAELLKRLYRRRKAIEGVEVISEE